MITSGVKISSKWWHFCLMFIMQLMASSDQNVCIYLAIMKAMIYIALLWSCCTFILVSGCQVACPPTTNLQNRDHSGCGLSQWEMMLHCDVVSHWLNEPTPRMIPGELCVISAPVIIKVLAWPFGLSSKKSDMVSFYNLAGVHCFVDYQLTHWGREKMTDILQTTLSNNKPAFGFR